MFVSSVNQIQHQYRHFGNADYGIEDKAEIGEEGKCKHPFYILTHWPLGDLDAILKLQFSISFYWLVSSHRLRIMPKSTLVQVMAWCRQATSHYLCQCWPSSMSPYGVTRSQWVKCDINRPVSQIRAPPGGLSRTSGKLWQDYSNCYMFWT